MDVYQFVCGNRTDGYTFYTTMRDEDEMRLAEQQGKGRSRTGEIKHRTDGCWELLLVLGIDEKLRAIAKSDALSRRMRPTMSGRDSWATKDRLPAEWVAWRVNELET